VEKKEKGKTLSHGAVSPEFYFIWHSSSVDVPSLESNISCLGIRTHVYIFHRLDCHLYMETNFRTNVQAVIVYRRKHSEYNKVTVTQTMSHINQ